jgi:hypothetical protein
LYCFPTVIERRKLRVLVRILEEMHNKVINYLQHLCKVLPEISDMKFGIEFLL